MSAVVVVCLATLVYFLPWVSARLRGHRQAPAIAMLNLLLGWTVIGWAVALVWSLTTDTEKGTPTRPEAKQS